MAYQECERKKIVLAEMRLLCDPQRKGYPFPVNPNPNPPTLFSCLDPVRAKHSITLSVERVMPNVPVLPTPTRAHHIDGSERTLRFPRETLQPTP